MFHLLRGKYYHKQNYYIPQRGDEQAEQLIDDRYKISVGFEVFGQDTSVFGRMMRNNWDSRWSRNESKISEAIKESRIVEIPSLEYDWLFREIENYCFHNEGGEFWPTSEQTRTVMYHLKTDPESNKGADIDVVRSRMAGLLGLMAREQKSQERGD